jgi:hypothetical protein
MKSLIKGYGREKKVAYTVVDERTYRLNRVRLCLNS